MGSGRRCLQRPSAAGIWSGQGVPLFPNSLSKKHTQWCEFRGRATGCTWCAKPAYQKPRAPRARHEGSHL
jgi:hypothetical protein